MLFDSHCHFNASEFDADRQAVWAQAQALGVRGLLIPAVKAADFEPLQSWRQPGINIALGLHPLYWRQHQTEHLDWLQQSIAHQRPCALGEIGLDFWPGTEGNAEQQALFDAQLGLAKRYDLPVILHARRSLEAVLLSLKRVKFEGLGVVHAFNGSAVQARQLVERGFYFGIGGGISYPRAQQTRSRAAELPLSRLLLETDAPDMPLAGCQGLRNSPAQLPRVAQSLALLRAIPVDEVIAQTGHNARQLLGDLNLVSEE